VAEVADEATVAEDAKLADQSSDNEDGEEEKQP